MRGIISFFLILGAFTILVITPVAIASPDTLQAETPFPIATGTPVGPIIIVPNQVNVRTCPSTNCDLVGVLIAGQQASAIGRSSGGEWIQIVYPGVPGNVAWVYSAFVVLESGPSLLPIVEPPPTPTPRITPTVNPTLAAQFNLDSVIATQLPTFTAAPPIVQPTFEPDVAGNGTGFPPILAIIALSVVGLFGLVISLLRGTGAGL
jgi:hypothetical protein